MEMEIDAKQKKLKLMKEDEDRLAAISLDRILHDEQ